MNPSIDRLVDHRSESEFASFYFSSIIIIDRLRNWRNSLRVNPRNYQTSTLRAEVDLSLSFTGILIDRDKQH